MSRGGQAERFRRERAARRSGPGPRDPVKRARRRTDPPEGLLRRPSPLAHRLGQFQPVGLVALRGASVCAGFARQVRTALAKKLMGF
jgi:hypothetical protein